jgi:hypothetical protein
MIKCERKSDKGPCKNKAMYIVAGEQLCFMHLQTALKEQLALSDSVSVRLVEHAP